MIDDGLRSIFHKHLPDGTWQAIETGGTGRGIPDSNFCFPPGVEGWVEFKKTDTYRVSSVKPEQVGWIERRIRAGGRVFVGVRRRCQAGPRKPAMDELWLWRGEAIRAIRDQPMSEIDRDLLLLWQAGGPSSWSWASIRTILTAPK